MRDYVCVDLETTGLTPRQNHIIEIGGVKVRDGQVVDTFSTFVNPGRQLETRIIELTGITDDDLKSAPSIREVLPEFLRFAEELPLLGHNVLFDYSFLKKEAVNLGLSFEREGVDTLQIARKYLPQLPSRSLGALCAYYQIPLCAHRALGDATATVALYQRLVADYFDEEESVFVPKPLIFTVKKESPATKRQKDLLYRLQERHRIDLKVDIEMLSKNEASRLADKIRSGAIHSRTCQTEENPL